MQGHRTAKRRKGLDRETIVDAAIHRVERHGLDELSARKLAQDLRCEAMSLYHHFESMEALKDAIVDALLGSIRPEPAGTPAQSLAREAQNYLDLAGRYPRSFQLIATRRWKGERAAATAGRAVARLRELGFESDEALRRARVLGAYLNGAGVALAAWVTEADAPNEDKRAVRNDLQSGLDLLLNALIAAAPAP